MFTPPQHCGDHFEGLLLARGVRHTEGAEAAIAQLLAGDRLRLRPEPENPRNMHAQLIEDAAGRPIGYLPNYLADELARLEAHPDELSLTVLKVNPPPGPVHHRLLCTFSCTLELGSSLFRGPMFDPISADASPVAA